MIISSVFLFEIYKSLTRQNEIVFFSILFSRCNARAYYLVSIRVSCFDSARHKTWVSNTLTCSAVDKATFRLGISAPSECFLFDHLVALPT
jgi:hypothetical protein